MPSLLPRLQFAKKNTAFMHPMRRRKLKQITREPDASVTLCDMAEEKSYRLFGNFKLAPPEKHLDQYSLKRLKFLEPYFRELEDRFHSGTVTKGKINNLAFIVD